MDIESLKVYSPIILGLVFFGYRFYKSKRIKRMIPELKSKGAQIVDVRSEKGFQFGNNPDSINIPLSKIATGLEKLKKNMPVIVCCATGTRSAMAARIMKSKGFEVYNAGNWQNTIQKNLRPL